MRDFSRFKRNQSSEPEIRIKDGKTTKVYYEEKESESSLVNMLNEQDEEDDTFELFELLTELKGNLKEIKDSYPAKKLEISVKQDIASFITEIGMKIEKNIDNNYEINIENEEQAHTLMKNLVQQGIKIDKFELKKPSLNDIFIEKVGA